MVASADAITELTPLGAFEPGLMNLLARRHPLIGLALGRVAIASDPRLTFPLRGASQAPPARAAG